MGHARANKPKRKAAAAAAVAAGAVCLLCLHEVKDPCKCNKLWCSEKRRNAAGVIFSPLRTNVVLRVSLHVLCFSRTGPGVGTWLHGNLCPLSCQVWPSLLGTTCGMLRYRFRTFFCLFISRPFVVSSSSLCVLSLLCPSSFGDCFFFLFASLYE